MSNKWKMDVKNITYLSKQEVGEDIHIVKEVFYNEDTNEYKDDIKIIKDFKRPFWITKPIYRTHKEKKEVEKISKVDRFLSTESDLGKNISYRLGDRYVNIHDLWRLRDSPYLYGIDVDSRTYLKKLYMKKTNDYMSPYRVGTFDIENDIRPNSKNDILIISVATYKEIKTFILKDFIKHIKDPIPRLHRLYDKYIPESDIKNITPEYIICDTEVEMIKKAFSYANIAGIDFLAAWNIQYDISVILDVLERNHIDPADVFHYYKIPSKYKHFSVHWDKAQKVTESGKVVPKNPEERWHRIKTTSNFYLIDAMSTHRYVRVGGKTVPGGYSLNNILKHEGVAKKLKFENYTEAQGTEWHMYMVEHRPLEYIIYNQWDVMSMLELDKKTKDLSYNTPLLLGVSHPDIFNSGPRRIIDIYNFFLLENKLVLGTRPSKPDKDKLLGLDNWIIALPSHLMANNGIKNIMENPDLHTNIRLFVYDSDAVSSYPSNIMAANISKDTTHREVVAIEGKDKELFKPQNINLMYGNTNVVEFAINMLNAPSLYDILKEVEKRIKENK